MKYLVEWNEYHSKIVEAVSKEAAVEATLPKSTDVVFQGTLGESSLGVELHDVTEKPD